MTMDLPCEPSYHLTCPCVQVFLLLLITGLRFYYQRPAPRKHPVTHSELPPKPPLLLAAKRTLESLGVITLSHFSFLLINSGKQ